MSEKAILETLDDLGEIGFLTGDASGDRETDIDDIFGKEFVESCEELSRYEPTWLEFDRSTSTVTPSEQDGFLFVDCEQGLLLVDVAEKAVIGGFLGADLVLHWDYHGRGLGREIVEEYFVRWDELPTWWLDDASLSTDGERTFCSAYASLTSRPEATLARVERVRAARAAAPYGLGMLSIYGAEPAPSLAV